MDVQGQVQQGMAMAEKLKDTVIEYIVKYGFQVLGGIIILIVGFKLAEWAAQILTDLCHKKKIDVTLTKFLAGLLKAVILVFVCLMALEKFGVTINPLIAAASAAIFGASFAIQAPLSNYAAGLSVILSRPFVVGNTITVNGVSGVVDEVKLPCTILSTGDGEKITIPNKDIVGHILHNSAEYKVVEGAVGISYNDDPQRAIDIIKGVLKKFPKISQSHAPQIGIQSFGDSSVNIGLRYWAPTKEYYQVLYAVNLEVYRALKEGKISMPYPQREVRMLS